MPSNSDIIFTKYADNPSLGGQSGSIVAMAGTIHELFDPVAPSQAVSGLVDYRFILVRNGHATDTMYGMKIYLSSETTSTSTTIQFGLLPGIVSFFPSTEWPLALANVTTAPVGVTFAAANSLGAAINLGDIPPQKTRVLYLKRVVTAGAASLASDVGTITVTNAIS